MVLTDTHTPAIVAVNGTVQEHGERKQRASHLRWIRIGDLTPAPRAQREYRPGWANELAAGFNLEGMGFIVVSHRGTSWFVIDGQHRLMALKILDFDDDTTVQCEVYENLTEREEAELFLERNHVKAVAALDKFRMAVNAERREEVEIETCVRHNGLRIGKGGTRRNSGISAVGKLRAVYDRVGTTGLGKVLRIIRDAYGEAGFEAAVIDGLGLVVQRYDGTLDEGHMAKALTGAAGGLGGLMTQATRLRTTTGHSVNQCVAATAVGHYNRTAGAKKLAPWWKE